jgi:hypothetical protein
MADTEAEAVLPTEPQSRHVVYCGGSCPLPLPLQSPTNLSFSVVCSLPPEVRDLALGFENWSLDMDTN